MDVGGAAPDAYGGQDRVARLLLGSGRNAAILKRSGLDRAMLAGVRSGLARPGFGGLGGSAGGGRGYNLDEPRDSRGRWTSGGGGSPGLGPGLLGRIGPAPNGLYGGRLFRIAGPGSGMGDNERLEEDEADASIDVPRAAQGWDVRPGETVGGLHYDPVRRPVLADGTPWPVATRDQVKAILVAQKGKMATMTVFVPLDGVGPMLVGSTGTRSVNIPKGYDEVALIAPPAGYGAVTFNGAPQKTFSQGVETKHASDSIDRALMLAASNKYSTIFFNRSFTTVTGGEVQSLLRADVVAVARPQLNLPHAYWPHEILSKGQTERDRQAAMPNSNSVARAQFKPHDKSPRR
jgi:hypothetical protein